MPLINLIIGLVIMAWPLSVLAAPVGLGWDAVTSSDLAGYRIYQSNVSATYNKATQKAAEIPKTTRTATINVTPEDGRTVYFVATAYDTAGNESGFSNEVSWTVPDKIPPDIPPNFKLTVQMTLNENGELLMSSAKIERTSDAAN